MNVKDPGPRLLRWRIQLAEYDSEITYRRGSQNTNANALSRIGSVSKEGDLSDEFNKDRKKKILYEFHDSTVGGHRGMNKTYRAIKSQYFWPNMRREVEEYVKQCRSFQVNKVLNPKHKAPMEMTTAEHPFDKCYLDIVGPLPVTQGNNKYILTFQDDLSKYVVAVALGQQDAETVARAFVVNIVLKYGAPSVLQIDQGANFVSEMFQNTCKMLKIKTIQSIAFHPESQGSIERSHRVLAEYLRHYVNEDETNWDEWVPFATYVYNTTVHSATRLTPFEFLFGHPPLLPSALKKPPEPQYNYDDYVSELRSRLQTVHHHAHNYLIESKSKSKENYDKTSGEMRLQVGDKVLLFNETVHRGRSRKLSAQWIGINYNRD